MTITRRGLFGILAAGLAPAIIRTPGLIMPVKALLVTAPQITTPWLTMGLRVGDTVRLPVRAHFGDGLTLREEVFIVTSVTDGGYIRYQILDKPNLLSA